MERKSSESAAVRWALELAIEGATPGVGGGHEGAPRRGDLPRELVKMRNEPIARRAGAGCGVAGTTITPATPTARTEMHRNAPGCTQETRDGQNEPISVPDGSARSPGAAQALRPAAAPRTDLHQNTPRCTARVPIVQNEPISTPESQLTPRQLTAIALLFSGRSYTAVGRELKIDRSTLFRWRRSPVFAEAVRRQYSAMANPQRVPARGALGGHARAARG